MVNSSDLAVFAISGDQIAGFVKRDVDRKVKTGANRQ
jgi:hypothetical protein